MVKIASETSAKGTKARLTGAIAAGAAVELAKALGAANGPLELDLSEVTVINSDGHREWKRFFDGRPPTEIASLVKCPPVVVMSANMFPQLLAKARIVSVYLDYRCETCSASRRDLVDVAQDLEMGAFTRRPAPCTACGGAVEATVDLEDYFRFAADAAGRP